MEDEKLPWVTWAETVREDQGPCCEMEAAHENAYEHNMLFKRCRKNPGHTRFIPLPELDMNHLPDACQNPDILKFVKSYAVHTVKLIVRFTSRDRPDRFGWTSLKGTKKARCGSGFIQVVASEQLQKRSVEEPVPGEEVELLIQTAAHVVFDEEEVKETTVELFFDDDADRSNVVLAKGVTLLSVSSDGDLCYFVARLESRELYPAVKEKLLLSLAQDGGRIPKWTNLSFCVSHPHGVAKRVTSGDVVDVSPDNVSFFDPGGWWKLVCFVDSKLGIDEKKVLYHHIYCVLLEELMTELPGLGISRLETKRAIMKHLMSQGFLECPDDDELTKLQEKLGEAFHIGEECVDELKRERENICGQVPAQSTDAESAQGCSRNTSGHARTPLDMSDKTLEAKFASECRRLMKELTKKLSELDTRTRAKISERASASYRLPTCPGSSGAPVVCVSKDGDVTRVVLVPHSRGQGPRVGASGKGGVVHF